jgi:hypothetical protein
MRSFGTRRIRNLDASLTVRPFRDVSRLKTPENRAVLALLAFVGDYADQA